jgi:hypothetical protein
MRIEIIKIEVKGKERGISWEYRRLLSVERVSVPSGWFEIPGTPG